MTVIEKARELAEVICKDPILESYRAATAAYEACPELQTKMTEYNAQRTILGQELSREVDEQNPQLVSMVRDRMNQLAKEISAMEEYKNLSACQLQVNNLMKQVNDEIQRVVFGIEPQEECTHDCSSCHANCPSKQ